MTDLFSGLPDTRPKIEHLADGAVVLPGFVIDSGAALLAEIEKVLAASPLCAMETPGGRRMSVMTSSCGMAGWVSDREGYRYSRIDPVNGKPWPPMPPLLFNAAQRAAMMAGFEGFAPDSCLINCYAPGARMSLHQDKNERDFTQPIVSVSLGLPITFLFGGIQRSDKPIRYLLQHGDVVVWRGLARLAFHGVMPLDDGYHLLLGRRRINLTFRRAL